MTRTCVDSTTVNDVPKWATMVAGYADGRYATLPSLRKRFPRATVVSITVNGSTQGVNVIDRETGDASPQGAARWCKTEITDGRHPTVYTYLSGVHDVVTALEAAAIKPGDVSLWTAHYTGKAHICTARCFGTASTIPARWLRRIVATQYADPVTSGGHYDLTLAENHWQGVDKGRPPLSLKARKRLKVRLSLLRHRIHRIRRKLRR